jgi:hypothetical protein
MLKGIDLFYLAGVLLSEGKNTFAHDPQIELIKRVALVLCVIAVLIVGYTIFVRGRRLTDNTSEWLLLIGFMILSPLAYFINFGIAIEESKPVNFCNSCHVMEGYVKDLKNPESEYVAAIHYKYRLIADNQCYQCHSEYGLFGTAKAKMSGIRHIWSYYIAGYEKPIKLRGTYDNHICLHCHGPVEDYQDVDEHKDYLKDLELNKQSCFGADCHVSPHPKEVAGGSDD